MNAQSERLKLENAIKWLLFFHYRWSIDHNKCPMCGEQMVIIEYAPTRQRLYLIGVGWVLLTPFAPPGKSYAMCEACSQSAINKILHPDFGDQEDSVSYAYSEALRREMYKARLNN